MTQSEIGSASHGTLRPDDLMNTFIELLQRFDPQSEFLEEAKAAQMAQGFNEVEYSAICADVNNTLINLLNNYAPPYCYFGAHPGDGSDFGFWPLEDCIDRMADDDVFITGELNYSSEEPTTEGALVAVGNVTLYRVKRSYEEVWSIA